MSPSGSLSFCAGSSRRHLFPGLLLPQGRRAHLPLSILAHFTAGRAYAMLFRMFDGLDFMDMLIWNLAPMTKVYLSAALLWFVRQLTFRYSFRSGSVDCFGVRISIRFNVLQLSLKRTEGDPFLVDYFRNILLPTSYSTSSGYPLSCLGYVLTCTSSLCFSFPVPCWLWFSFAKTSTQIEWKCHKNTSCPCTVILSHLCD